MSEQASIDSQEKLFKNMKNVEWRKIVDSAELGKILSNL